MIITWDQKVAFFQGIADAVLADAVQKKVLPSLTMAQAALESDYNTSVLSAVYHNLFGIKGAGTAGSVSLPTVEYDEHGNPQHVNADFASYASVGDSIAAHTDLFLNGTSDNPQRYAGVLAATTSQEATAAVQAGGYATDPRYAALLDEIIAESGLTGYDDQYHAKLAELAQAAAQAPQEPEAPAAEAEAAPVDEEAAALAWAVSAGLIKGDGTDDFGAGEPLLRGHFVIVLKRLHDAGFLVK